MKKVHSHSSLSNFLNETQKLRRQNANALRSRSVRCLSRLIVEFLRTHVRIAYLFFRTAGTAVFIFTYWCIYFFIIFLFMNGDVNIASVASLSQFNTKKYKYGLLKFIKM